MVSIPSTGSEQRGLFSSSLGGNAGGFGAPVAVGASRSAIFPAPRYSTFNKIFSSFGKLVRKFSGGPWGGGGGERITDQ